ncbi:MAG: hypothetical protein KAS32_25145 [Candidatus Peribacteraceae bacterium]|nr:hypothetical protein [Candidatus Peribacteraceae bacterium]
MEPRLPCKNLGESSIKINGEDKIIRFSLGAQMRMIEALGLETIEQIPDLIRKMDANILITMIQSALIPEHEMSKEDLLEASIPMIDAQVGIVAAIGLATHGVSTEDSPLENKTETQRSVSPGASQEH